MTKPRPKPDDEAQSQRFIDMAGELEAAGELNPTEAGETFERLFPKIAKNVPADPKGKR